MSTPGTGPQDGPSPSRPPQGFPPPVVPQGYAPPAYGPPRRRWGGLVAGLLIGLLVGAGGLGLVWALTSGGTGSGGDDYEVVCGLVVRTEPLTEDYELGDVRRLAGVGELAAALAEEDPTRQPLADELEKSVRAVKLFEVDQAGTSLRRAQDICRD